ncbi:MAG: pyridoxal-phosphate dependent enzyme [Sphaerobacteraceae bacterium]|nr:MAG: pyridoxal-phosphate dependent enzyme [Sphaerobacteraceae bacterium]
MTVNDLSEPTIQDVLEANLRIRNELWPVVPRMSAALSRIAGRDVWLIPENLQRTGSFKFRGALNRMLLHAQVDGSPVVTASSGNHAIGMTVAAGLTGIEMVVVVPESVSSAKLGVLEDLGATCLRLGSGFDDAEDRMYQYAEEHGLMIVNAFDRDVIAGHGTCALNALKHVPDLEVLVAPVASGGLISGCAIVMNAVSPDAAVIGVQTSEWPAMKVSLEAGQITSVSGGSTVADGLEGNATRSGLPFEIIQQHVERIDLVDEASILRAMKFGITTERMILEGAGSVTIAAILDGIEMPGTGPIGVVISGGNAAEKVVRQALDA